MKKICYTTLFLFLIWAGGFVAFNHHINHYQIDENTKTDAIVVLTGGRNRIVEAVRLINNDMADIMLISGVEKGVSLKQIADKNKVILPNGGRVFIENKSQNTVENAVETNNWIKEHKINSIRLVTSNYHIPRSMQEFYLCNKDLKIIANPVYSQNVSQNIWKNFGSFNLIASEYHKFLYTYLKTILERLL